ncbi:vitamin B6 photo-protection and homoeostasis-domain-containing protein [Pavlovales sp. CCMP2436]|nr:vitamin B6 photo-protection and homoeostasis-domain-containing protein [Pavlovales sp. CCMP2436]
MAARGPARGRIAGSVILLLLKLLLGAGAVLLIHRNDLRRSARSGAGAVLPIHRDGLRRLERSGSCVAAAAANRDGVAPRSELVLGELSGERADRLEWDGRAWRRVCVSEPASSPLDSAIQRVVLRPLARLLLMKSDAVRPEYYTFTKWRMLQRMLSAIKDVFATQALLGALGGAAATGAWIGKESLGRASKIIWSGKMKKLMDVDAKRLRFRTAILYPLGQLLELACLWHPQYFLLLGTCGIFCKQISQMTASATRSAFYRSFSADGLSGAIGEMTATGDAQVSVASAIGIGIGIFASEWLLGGRAAFFPPVFALLCAADVAATYREVRAVVCRRLSHERTQLVLKAWASKRRVPSPEEVAGRERVLLGPSTAFCFAAPAELALGPDQLSQLFAPWEQQVFAVVPSWACSRRDSRSVPEAQIVLSAWASRSPEGVLYAWLAHAWACRLLAGVPAGDLAAAADGLRAARVRADEELPELRAALASAGWQLDSFAYLPIGADDSAARMLTRGPR